jgi:hypothetical protein
VTGGWCRCPSRARRIALFLVVLAAPAVQAASFSELALRGFGLLNDQRYEEAAEALSAALELEPDSMPARKGLATASAALGASRLRAGKLRESADS